MLQRWNRLSFRIPAIVLAMTLLPTLLVGLIAARISRTALTQKVAVSNLGIAADEIAEIDFWLHHTAEVLQVAATRPTFGSADRDMEKLRSALEPLLKVLPSAEKLTVLDESGMELVILSRDEVFTSADYESRAAEPAVRRALNGEVDLGQTAVTPDGTPYRTIAVPIWNVRRDTAVGVLQAEFSLAELINQIATRSVGENGYLVILDQDQRIISHPDFSRVLAGEIYNTHLQGGRVVYSDANDAAMRRWADGEGTEMFSVFAGSDDGAWTVVVEQPVDEAVREAALWDQTLLVVSLAIFLFVLLLGWRLTYTFSRPLREVTTAARGIARGELGRPPQTVREDEIGQLAEAFRATNAYLQKAVSQADAIAAGDFSAEIAPRSEADVLGIALQRMTETLRQAGEVAQAVAAGNTAVQIPIKGENDMLATAVNRMTAILDDTATQADQIAAGNYVLEFTPRSDEDRLGHALQRMVRQLRQVTAENERRLWKATGQSELSAAMRGITAVDELAQAIVTYLSQYLGAQMGALYVSTGAQQLRLAGKFAFVDAAEVPERFPFGDGLVGQVAADQTPLHLAPVPADYFHIHSGLGDALPAQLIIFPFHFAGAVQGVLELATTAVWGEKELEFLHDVAETVAISLRVAGEQAKNARLLQQTQEQAEELRQRAEEMSAQQEELRQTNEQLVMQTKALQDSEKALQTQQEELRATNEELEEKTEMLQRQQEVVESKNDQLLQTQRELEERAEQLAITSKYKSEFLSNMSHELRTPLNSLLILARMLQDNEEGNLTAEQIESIAVIYESGQDLLQLINEILDLAKVEAGKVEAYLEMVSLADLLTTMARKYTHFGEEKGVGFVTELDPELPTMLHTDGKRVEQILRNLLSNAFKFTTEGTVTLRIAQPASANPELRAHGLDPEQSVAISVRDTGIGISPADQKMVFEAFQQVDGTISRKYGGTGLGLSISRELATLLGGFIGLESELGVGSTFTLYLPFAAPQAAVASPARAESLPAPPPPPANGRSPARAPLSDDRGEIKQGDRVLLIIEDDPKFARILHDFARGREFKCLLAGSGEEGLQLVREYGVTAVLLDLQLPGINGWDVLRELKSAPETRHIPVHMTSVLEESLEAYKQGALGYLHKPASPDSIDAAFTTLDSFISKDVKSLLIVEDDAVTRMSLRKLIGGDDIALFEAEDGAEALQLLRREPIDCVILDLNLPDMTGFALLDTLEGETAVRKPPVIVYTGRELTREENNRLLQYADTVIVKGVKSEERLLDETALFLHRVVADLPQSKQSMIRRLHDSSALLTDKKILLVDDDMRNAFALSKLLSERGMQVELAADGQKALDILAAQSDIDLVLMDVMMPVMDGYEAIQRIRAQPQFHALPILALTAKAMRGDREKCLQAGANDYLAKPVDVDRLLSMLQVWLSG